MKAHIKRWVNEKHDVLTAADMKTALESYNGVKACRVAVVQVDPLAKSHSSDNKIPGISLLNNFAYTNKGIRVWRSYNNGIGNILTYQHLGVVPQQNTNLQVLQEFGPQTRPAATSTTTSKRQADIFPCCESTCILTFKTMTEAETHMDTGRHVMASEHDSIYDIAKKRWAEQVTEMNVASHEHHYIPVVPAESTSSNRQLPSKGWALKSTKIGKRMTERAKAFLLEKFTSGLTGQKADPSKK